MRAGATASPRSPIGAGVQNPWLVAVLVALAAFMEVLDTTIANVALRYVAGGLGVSVDEASWVVTSYLVANAIALVASSFFARRFGRKSFFIACLGLFTVSSVLCGFAWNLDSLLLFRVLQGLGGGGMVPVAQSILASSFPPEKRGQAFALFGVAVVVAPVVGPTLGGWLSDNWSWHWCFLINGPVGLLTIGLIWLVLREEGLARSDHVRFDFIGFALVATFLGALEVVLDRGLIDDWLGSAFIVSTALVCGLSFLLMIPWELSRANPMVDIRMLASRQLAACFLIMGSFGVVLYATTQFLPQLVQEDFGYTATWAGLVLSPGGLVTMAMMFIVGRLSGHVQPKYLIAAGGSIIALSMYVLTNVNPSLDFWFFADSRMLLGLGLPLILIPIITASYEGLSPEKYDQASALINVARNTGGSIGVSLASNVLAHREQFHQARLVENTIPSSVQFQQALHQVTQYFVAQGSSLVEAKQQALAWIGQAVQAQASLFAYVDVFWTLTLVALAVVPLALALRSVAGGQPVHAAH